MIREARTLADMDALAELQQAAWQYDEREIVPASVFVASQHAGALVALAYQENQPCGFVYGYPAYRDGVLWHHSHMLALKPQARSQGLAVGLKRFQRNWVLERGIDLITWTFDPLLTRNARLNLGKLGAYSARYIPDFYGMRSGIYAGLAADRLWVSWELNSERVLAALQETPPPPLPQGRPANRVAWRGGLPYPQELLEPEAEQVYLEVPYDIAQLKAADLELARLWRAHTREAFLYWIAKGYRVIDLARDGERDFYQLGR